MDDIIDAVVLSLSAMRWEISGKTDYTRNRKRHIKNTV